MRIVISNTSGVPIYEQIVRQITEAIVSGELQAGSPLPSLRELARDLRVSLITTTRAYSDLANHGFIVNVPGKGSFVQERSLELTREHYLVRIEEHLRQAAALAQVAGITRNELDNMLNIILRGD
ncbi:MAG TPA: GntR family transcriptional regulator [Coriobacteriia bacterium]|nr:GntR family transcriptional regulator [Coriobacteriia bacterium]